MPFDVAILRSEELFSHLDNAALAEIAAGVSERVAGPGERVVAEGEPADSLFLVLSGTLRVLTVDAAGREIGLARLSAGDHFGEQALRPGPPSPRTATVRADDDVRLLEIPRALLLRAFAPSSNERASLLALGEARVREGLLRRAEALRFLDLSDLEQLRREEFAPGQLLFRKGDPSDKLYLLVSGAVEVDGDLAGSRRLCHKVSAGQCVGELGLMDGAPRTATVRALEHVTALTLDEVQFRALMERSPAMQGHVLALRRCRKLEDNASRSRAGFVTQVAGRLNGEDCVTTSFRFDDGRLVVVSVLNASQAYHLEIYGAPPAEERTLRWPPEGERLVELRVSAGVEPRLLGALVTGDWPGLRALHRLALSGEPIVGLERFVAEGALESIEPAGPDLICVCLRVPHAAALEAVLSGCADPEAVAAATGCGTVCGACKPAVAALLGESGCRAATLALQRELSPDTPDQLRRPPYPQCLVHAIAC